MCFFQLLQQQKRNPIESMLSGHNITYAYNIYRFEERRAASAKKPSLNYNNDIQSITPPHPIIPISIFQHTITAAFFAIISNNLFQFRRAIIRLFSLIPCHLIRHYCHTIIQNCHIIFHFCHIIRTHLIYKEREINISLISLTSNNKMGARKLAGPDRLRWAQAHFIS